MTSEQSEQTRPDHKTLILIDGHALAYRMYFALENTQMRTKEKQPTWAVYGFFSALFSLLQNTKPDAMAVSFDLDSDTFRKEMYAEYKAHRQAMPDDLRLQMDAIKEGVRLLGMPVYEKHGFEADDVIGTLAKKGRQAGWWVKILTGDQDSFQLVKDWDPEFPECGPIQVLIPPRTPREGLRTFDRQAVFDKLGVYPEQVIDYKGLRGDTSDNIPGIPGVGEKTAVKLLTDYPTMEEIYAHLEEMPKNKLLEKLTTYHDQAMLSKRLATIDEEVPIEIQFDDCHLSIPDWQALTAFFERNEFKAFIRQAPILLSRFSGAQASGVEPSGIQENEAARQDAILSQETDQPANEGVSEAAQPIAETLRVEHLVINQMDQLQALIQRIETVGVFAIDIETTGLDVMTSGLVGIAITVADGLSLEQVPTKNLLNLPDYPETTYRLSANGQSLENMETAYIPLGHCGENNSDCHQLKEADVLAALKPILQGENICKIAHNVKFEANFFNKLGVPLKGPAIDTMLASYIEDPEGRHGLKTLGFQHCQYLMQEIKELIGSGKKEIPFSEVKLIEAAAYAACDTHVTLELAWKFAQKFNHDASGNKWALLTEIEIPLAFVLAQLERDGVSLDTNYLKSLSDTLAEQLAIVEAKIYELAGGEFNINSPKQVGDVLFERLQIQPLRKTKGKSAFSTDVKVLEMLSGEHPVVDEILKYRQLFKLKSTYVDALPQLINPVTGRLHTSFNQAVAVTGRLSSSNPNLQNIPIRTELGREIRRAFVPKDAKTSKLLSADYSQIELRLLAHFSEDPNLLKAFQNGEDVHQATAALVFGLEMASVTKEMRYKAKAVNFGVVYGQSAHGLSQQLKIPRAEAAEFIERYFFKYKNVKNFIESVKAEAHKTGEVQTISGRIRNLSEGLRSSVRGIREFSERAAFNTPLQGSAADLMKIAMIRLNNKLKTEGLKSQIILQVHDELVLEVPDDELDQVTSLVKWAMELEQPLKVPLVIDVSVGESWLES